MILAMKPTLQVLTVGRIAQITGEPVHRIDYIVRTRNIQPRARAGRLRVFDSAGLAAIKRELESMRASQEGRR